MQPRNACFAPPRRTPRQFPIPASPLRSFLWRQHNPDRRCARDRTANNSLQMGTTPDHYGYWVVIANIAEQARTLCSKSMSSLAQVIARASRRRRPANSINAQARWMSSPRSCATARTALRSALLSIRLGLGVAFGTCTRCSRFRRSTPSSTARIRSLRNAVRRFLRSCWHTADQARPWQPAAAHGSVQSVPGRDPAPRPCR